MDSILKDQRYLLLYIYLLILNVIGTIHFLIYEEGTDEKQLLIE